MNSLVKIGIAGALALGSVAANAGITTGNSSNATGDVILFADVFNGTSLVQSYVGDTQIHVTDVGGTTPPATFLDGNLQTLLNAASGNTVIWAVEGGGGTAAGGEQLVSAGTAANINNAALGASGLASMASGLHTEGNGINGGLGANTSGLFGTSTAQAGLGGSGFNPLGTSADAHTWFGNTFNVSVNGLGATSTLFGLTSDDQQFDDSSIASLFNVSLTSAGLTFTDIGSGSVPIPGALWLLGSGLLGLAGVARRKTGFTGFQNFA